MGCQANSYAGMTRIRFKGTLHQYGYSSVSAPSSLLTGKAGRPLAFLILASFRG
jgi:hypothetical protein